MIALVLTLLLKALVVLGVARVVPGVRVSGFGSALAVAVTYGLLTMVLHQVLVVVTLPLVLLSFGLFMLVINGFLLFLTDKLLRGFEITSWGALALATLGLTLGDVVVQALVQRLP